MGFGHLPFASTHKDGKEFIFLPCVSNTATHYLNRAECQAQISANTMGESGPGVGERCWIGTRSAPQWA